MQYKRSGFRITRFRRLQRVSGMTAMGLSQRGGRLMVDALLLMRNRVSLISAGLRELFNLATSKMHLCLTRLGDLNCGLRREIQAIRMRVDVQPVAAHEADEC